MPQGGLEISYCEYTKGKDDLSVVLPFLIIPKGNLHFFVAQTYAEGCGVYILVQVDNNTLAIWEDMR
jgi:hypothetical protein